MKNKVVIGSLILITAVMLASFSSVMATTFAPTILVSNQATTWTIPTDKMFDAKDVLITTIEVEYWVLEEDGSLSVYSLYPHKISIGRWQIKLFFDPYAETNPFPEYSDGSVVTGLLSTGDDFVASGPGWTSSFRPR